MRRQRAAFRAFAITHDPSVDARNEFGAMISQALRPLNAIVGEPRETIRLTAVFACGACFKLFPMRLDGRIAAGVFWIAFKVPWRWFRTLNAKDDISYGLYLYAWPIATLLLWYWRDVPILAHGLLTLLGSVILGALSWWWLEKPFMQLKDRLRPRV